MDGHSAIDTRGAKDMAAARMKAKDIVSRMTLEEKAGMCSGHGFWTTKAVERLGAPSVMLTDGPHGLRKQEGSGDHLAINDSVVANCFPAGSATAASFDRSVVRRVGEALGRECQAEGVSVILGPAMNIKRTPLCGRNFEYISEDPFLTGEMAVAYTEGVQSQGVGASPKHFALNNQEHERMAGSSEIDGRTFREIYLSAFETLVRRARPWTVMSSYNKINGLFAGESHELLTEILRDEWGFDGCVVSDWGAVSDRVEALKAGMDLEMPPSAGYGGDERIVAAVRDGRLDERVVDSAAERVLSVALRYSEGRSARPSPERWDRERDHALAREIAAQCLVLLKNDGMLPLAGRAGRDASGAGDGPAARDAAFACSAHGSPQRIAFVGGFAATPRFQGGGSSHVNAWKVDSALEAAACYCDVAYAEGFCARGEEDDPAKRAAAVKVAAEADAVVVFAGLPDEFETEGKDRAHMRLPACQDALIAEILAVQKNVAVVLQNGSPVEMPWAGGVRAILECYIGGEAVSSALVDTLFGRFCPGGKLPETFPLRFLDTPAALESPGAGKKTRYSEGVFVGYRYYDARMMPVLFPFGHGLSYTTFSLSAPRISSTEMRESGTLDVEVDVTNTGTMAGKEVVQIYVRDETGAAVRPPKELKGFEAVRLEPGETKTVKIRLGARAFQWYNDEIGRWYAETGDYALLVGTSSRDIAFEEKVRYVCEREAPLVVTQDTQIGELRRHPAAVAYLMSSPYMKMPIMEDAGAMDPEWMALIEAMTRYMPIRGLRYFGTLTDAQIAEITAELNKIVG